MKTVLLKPAGAALNLRGLLPVVKCFIKAHAVQIAVTSALISFGAMLAGSVLAAAISGAIALLIAGNDHNATEKGGAL